MTRRRKLSGTPLRLSDMRADEPRPCTPANDGSGPFIVVFQARARELAEEALEALATLMRSASSEHVRVSAANALLDRALGKPSAGSRTAAGVHAEDEPITEVQWVAP